MISNVSAFLTNVQSLNNPRNNKITTSKEGKDTESSAFEVQDIVNISSKMTGSRVNNSRLQNIDIQQESVSEKTDIQSAGDKRLEDAPIEAQSGRKREPVESNARLSEPEKKEVAALQQRDLEVRQHEQAHLAAAGRYAGGMSLTTKVGPDGKHYAVGGEVSIDMSEVPGDPDATIVKAQAIRRAANAPANPSSQDRIVAADATRMEANARLEKIQQEKQLEDETDPSETIHKNNQQSTRAFSAYGFKDSEAGKLLNKAV